MGTYPIPPDRKTTGSFGWTTPFRGQGVLSNPSDPWDDDLYKIFDDIDSWVLALESGGVIQLEEYESSELYTGTGPIIQVRSSFVIDQIEDVGGPGPYKIYLAAAEGDIQTDLLAGKRITVSGSGINDGTYTVVSATYLGATVIEVEESVTSEGPGLLGVLMTGVSKFRVGHRLWQGDGVYPITSPAPCGFEVTDRMAVKSLLGSAGTTILGGAVTISSSDGTISITTTPNLGAPGGDINLQTTLASDVRVQTSATDTVAAFLDTKTTAYDGVSADINPAVPGPQARRFYLTDAGHDNTKHSETYLTSAALSGVSLADLGTRNHSDLQNILGSGAHHLSLSEHNTLTNADAGGPYNADSLHIHGSSGVSSLNTVTGSVTLVSSDSSISITANSPLAGQIDIVRGGGGGGGQLETNWGVIFEQVPGTPYTTPTQFSVYTTKWEEPQLNGNLLHFNPPTSYPNASIKYGLTFVLNAPYTPNILFLRRDSNVRTRFFFDGVEVYSVVVDANGTPTTVEVATQPYTLVNGIFTMMPALAAGTRTIEIIIYTTTFGNDALSILGNWLDDPKVDSVAPYYRY